MRRAIRTEAMILADERKRMDAILGSAEGQRNPKLARELVTQGATVEQAGALLKLAPAENPYLDAMDAMGTVGISGPMTSGEPVDPRAARLAEIKAAGASFRALPAPGAR